MPSLHHPRRYATAVPAAAFLCCAGLLVLAASASASGVQNAPKTFTTTSNNNNKSNNNKTNNGAAAPVPVPATAANNSNEKKKRDPPPIPPLPTPTPYVICEGQTYALCAAAEAFFYQNVAYAKCVIKQGDSISAPPLAYRDGAEIKTICDVNEAGVNNGFMMSTFSLPEAVKKGGTKAIYTCPGGSVGGYAQCDGGTCFTSTIAETFPGVGDLNADEIICSCPLVFATTANAPFGWQFIADYPNGECDQDAFSVCALDPRNGDLVPVGAPPGAGRVLTQLLYGEQYELNECFPQ
jgi:hypothetical protein